jgi:putative transposase
MPFPGARSAGRDTLTLGALRMAIERRRPAPGLVHHSDRGVQYASRHYTKLLRENGIQISMSRRGNPYDNAKCESFMKTLKYEEVYRQEYRDLAEARASIEHFLEKVYNEKRLHSAPGYLPPAAFECSLRSAREATTTSRVPGATR